MARHTFPFQPFPRGFTLLPGNRPCGRSLLLAWVCLAALSLTLLLHVRQPPPSLDEDALRASRQMLDCLEELRALRLEMVDRSQAMVADNPFSEQNFSLDPHLDPLQSGLIGVEYTDLTSTLGDLRAKQTSLNPAFAALTVVWLKGAGVQKGDRVALAFSGSFPALNLAVLCACDALELRPTVFSSVGASSYGANIPGLTWLDMEKRLWDKGLIHCRTGYASLGGIMDTGGGLGETGITLGEAAIARHGATYVREGTPAAVERDARRRMEIYFAEGRPAAFVNVGGNVTSLGWVAEAALLENGLLLPAGQNPGPGIRASRGVPVVNSPRRGVIFRMFEKGVPVLHLLNIERLAASSSLPVPPREISASGDLNRAWRERELGLALVLLGWLLLGLGGIIAGRATDAEVSACFRR